MLCFLSRSVSAYEAGRDDSSKLHSIGNTSASLRSRRSARGIAYTDAAISTNAQAVKMCPQLKKLDWRPA
jgi:hypothetical protein